MSEPVGLPEFIEANSAALLRFAWALCGNWSTAEDLVQTALVATWPRWNSLTRGDRPELYVRRVITTTYLRWQRRGWRAELPTALADQHGTHADHGAEVDNRDLLVQSLKRLPPRQRAVIVVSYFLDLPEAEAAAVLGCSRGTIKRQKHAALARLRAAPELASIFAPELTNER